MIYRVELLVASEIVFSNYTELVKRKNSTKEFETPKMYQGCTKDPFTSQIVNRRVYKDKIGEIVGMGSLYKLLQNPEEDFLYLYTYVEDTEEKEEVNKVIQEMFKIKDNEVERLLNILNEF